MIKNRITGSVNTIIKQRAPIDFKVEKIEALVASHFGITQESIRHWVVDGEAKILTCYLLHTLYRYDLDFLAKTYRIDLGYLSNRLRLLSQKIANDEGFDRKVKSLLDGAIGA